MLTLSASVSQMQCRGVYETECKLRSAASLARLGDAPLSCSGGTDRELSSTTAEGTEECTVRFSLMFQRARSDRFHYAAVMRNY